MAGMRDRLIHDYFGVDYELVWDVAQNRIPELRRHIAEILRVHEAAASGEPGAPPSPSGSNASSGGVE